MNSVATHLAPFSPAEPSAAQAHKIAKAAREFESVLLNMFLGPLEHTFSSLPGKESDAISSNYQSMGMQALASGLAARGGFGIADMIVKSLSQHGSGPSPHEKSLARGASLARPF